MTALKLLKDLFLNKETRFYILILIAFTPIWLYTITINFHWWDLLFYPMSFLIGWRFGLYGALGFIPGGGWIYDRHYHTIHFWPVLKTWRTRWMFLCENNFSVDFFYMKKEMFKGDPTSVREVTGPACVTIGIGFNKYLFDLQ